MMLRPAILCGLILAAPFVATGAAALELTLPSTARQTTGLELGLDSYAMPTGAFDGSEIPSRRFEGFVQKQAWRVDGVGITPLQILGPLRDQLSSNDYQIVFQCADVRCGGFDFRFGTEIIAPPDMLVDLDNFQFLAALKGAQDTPNTAVSLLVSRSRDAVYVQIIQVSVENQSGITIDRGKSVTGTQALPTAQIAPTALGKQLEVGGHVILSDLEFATGSAELGAGPFASLAEIAAYLRANPTRRVALVGHTDAVGGLNGNIALSKRRAASVKARLVDSLGVPEAQLAAEGVGFLAPVANNLSAEGREANRRVEAVLISTE